MRPPFAVGEELSIGAPATNSPFSSQRTPSSLRRKKNPSNVEKSPEDVRIDKFGQNALDAPSNLVWIPRSKHQLITDYYNSIDPNDPLRRLRRQVVAQMDFDAQLEEALATLTMFGVLQ